MTSQSYPLHGLLRLHHRDFIQWCNMCILLVYSLWPKLLPGMTWYFMALINSHCSTSFLFLCNRYKASAPGTPSVGVIWTNGWNTSPRHLFNILCIIMVRLHFTRVRAETWRKQACNVAVVAWWIRKQTWDMWRGRYSLPRAHEHRSAHSTLPDEGIKLSN